MDTSPRQAPPSDPVRLAAYLYDAALTDDERAFAMSVEASFEPPLAFEQGLDRDGYGRRPVPSGAGAPLTQSRFDEAVETLMTTAARDDVLVVDGTPVSQATAVRMLTNCGFRARVASDRIEALTLLHEQAFAAVLIECDVTAHNGFEMVSEIRRLCRGEERIPVIATTAGMTAGERARLLAAGIDDFLPKPLRNQPLKDMLARWVDAMPAPAAIVAPGPALLQEAIVAELESLDGEMLDTLLRLYFAETDDLLPALRTAADRGEALAVRQGAHKLRGSSCALGAAHVSDLYAELEAAAGAGDLIVAGDLLDRIPVALSQTRKAFDGRTAMSAR